MYSYYTTITGWGGVLLRFRFLSCCVIQGLYRVQGGLVLRVVGG